jgi:hypothetical protein
MASDFAVGETVDVLHKASNGKVTYGRAAVLDVQRKPMTWRGGTVYVCWLPAAEDLRNMSTTGPCPGGLAQQPPARMTKHHPK